MATHPATVWLLWEVATLVLVATRTLYHIGLVEKVLGSVALAIEMGSMRHCALPEPSLLPTKEDFTDFYSFDWPDQRFVRMRRGKLLINTASRCVERIFYPGALFFDPQFAGTLFPFASAAYQPSPGTSCRGPSAA